MRRINIPELLDLGENAELECKLTKKGVPNAIWETYSFFANTNGGIILLGVEEKDDTFKVQSVDIENLQKNFWNQINTLKK
ncbi:Putative DNA-binding domain-containing protein [Salimicrobium flavidum]|uniref:Putative DNA-binding domain-containing protein n=1 Tax=Salimicrobium flavidum TaxID=570947 RepID=A0A1N7KMM4_9BACI|nr:Putative DNA-binding domain-containing protein [Salimicrobium flavidum]